LWKLCDINSQHRPIIDAIRIFGRNLEPFIGRRLLFTVTADKKELRCWYGIPDFIDECHVDSNAQGLLFWLRADEKVIRKYIYGLLDEETRECIFVLPNGTEIYGLMW
jgi:hypothetical protein